MRHPEEWTGDGAGVGHPDEGTIHAWLDDALPAAEAAALERHVAGCAECAAAVAEARGLIAASSQILARLDRVPGGVLPAGAAGAAASADASVAAAARASAPAAVPAGDPTVVSLDARRRAPAPLWRRGGVRALAAAALLAVGATAVLRQTGGERSLSEVSSASDAAVSDPVADAAPVLAAESAAGQATLQESAPEVPDAARQRGLTAAASEPAPSSTVARPRAVADVSADASAEQRAATPRAVPAPMVPAGSSAVATAPAAPRPQARLPFAARRADTLAPRETMDRGVAGGVARPVATDSAAVVGRVVAQGSGAPVPGAVVRLLGRSELTVTDSGGRFALAGLPAGSYVAQVRRLGYQPESVTVRSAGDEPVARVDQLTVALRPDTLRLEETVVTGVAAQRPAAKVAGTPAPVAAPAPSPAPSPVPAQPLPAAAERFVGCYRLSVGGTASEARDRIEGALPGWLRLERRPDASAGWFVAGSGAGEAGVTGARWQAAGDAVTVTWPDDDDRVLALRLRPWVDGLAGTAAWRGAAGEAAGEEVSVLARRVVCGG